MKISRTVPRRGARRGLVATAFVGSALLALSACAGGSTTETPEEDSASSDVCVPESIRLVAPAGAGGGYDLTARTSGRVLEEEGLVDFPITIENREGADGGVWLAQMATEFAGDDGEIAVASTAPMFLEIPGELDFGFRDVTMIASLMNEYYAIVVPADSPYESLNDVVDAILEDPESVPVGGGSLDRGAMDLIVQAAGGDPNTINFTVYETGADQTVGLLNGDLAVGVSGTPEFGAQVEDGTLRAVAVTNPEQFPDGQFAGVPTAVEQGYDVTLGNWRGIYGPPDMPECSVKYWEQVLGEMVETELWAELAANNQWTTLFLTGDDFDKLVEDTYELLTAALKATGRI